MSTEINIHHSEETVKFASEVTAGDVVWDRDEGFLVSFVSGSANDKIILHSKQGDYWTVHKDRYVTILPNIEALRECNDRARFGDW